MPNVIWHEYCFHPDHAKTERSHAMKRQTQIYGVRCSRQRLTPNVPDLGLPIDITSGEYGKFDVWMTADLMRLVQRWAHTAAPRDLGNAAASSRCAFSHCHNSNTQVRPIDSKQSMLRLVLKIFRRWMNGTTQVKGIRL